MFNSIIGVTENMEHLVPVIIVSLIVAFFMYKNIDKITANIDVLEDNSYELYAKYARIVEKYIKNIEEIIDKNSVLKEDKYILKDKSQTDKIKEKLFALVRKLAFFETLKAKEKDKKELETKFFEILSSLDIIVKDNFIDGEKLADELREILHNEYQNLREGYIKN